MHHKGGQYGCLQIAIESNEIEPTSIFVHIRVPDNRRSNHSARYLIAKILAHQSTPLHFSTLDTDVANRV